MLRIDTPGTRIRHGATQRRHTHSCDGLTVRSDGPHWRQQTAANRRAGAHIPPGARRTALRHAVSRSPRAGASTPDDGRIGEELAHRYLLRRCWFPVARNWAVGAGELDIVMRRRGILAIVEVKTRHDPAALEEPVSLAQRSRIIRAAAVFVARREDLSSLAVRFDLVTVDRSRHPAQIRHIPGAFAPSDRRTDAVWPDRDRRWIERIDDGWA